MRSVSFVSQDDKLFETKGSANSSANISFARIVQNLVNLIKIKLIFFCRSQPLYIVDYFC